jgi:inner membrane protein
MMYYTHVPFAALCYTVVAKTGVMPNEGIEVVAAMVGGLLPDLDTPRSWLGRRIPLVSAAIGGIFGHRQFTHSALAVVLLTVGLVYVMQAQVAFAGGLIVGYLSHVLGDYLTPRGVPFLWPSKVNYASPKPFSLPTGGVVESTFAGMVSVLLLWAYGLLPLGMLAGLK